MHTFLALQMPGKKRKAERQEDEDETGELGEPMEDAEGGGGGGGGERKKPDDTLPFRLQHLGPFRIDHVNYDEKTGKVDVGPYVPNVPVFEDLPPIKIEEACCVLIQVADRQQLRALMLDGTCTNTSYKKKLRQNAEIVYEDMVRHFRGHGARDGLRRIWDKVHPDDQETFVSYVTDRHHRTEKLKKQKRAEAQKAADALKADLMSDDTLRPMLHKLYAQTHCYRQPSVVQVVGWTKERVITRSIPLQTGLVGEVGADGWAHIDAKWLDAHPPPTLPLNKHTGDTRSMRVCATAEDKPYLQVSKNAIYFPTSVSEKFQWSEY